MLSEEINMWDGSFIPSIGVILKEENGNSLLKFEHNSNVYKYWVRIETYSKYTCIIEQIKALFGIYSQGVNSIIINIGDKKRKYIIRPAYYDDEFLSDEILYKDLSKKDQLTVHPQIKRIFLFKYLCFISNNNLSTINIIYDDGIKALSIGEKTINMKDKTIPVTMMNKFFPEGNFDKEIIKTFGSHKIFSCRKVEKFFDQLKEDFELKRDIIDYIDAVFDNIITHISSLST